MDWARILAFATGAADQELLAPAARRMPGRPSGPVSPKTLAGRPFTDAARERGALNPLIRA
jgi:hypothetical protein